MSNGAEAIDHIGFLARSDSGDHSSKPTHSRSLREGTISTKPTVHGQRHNQSIGSSANRVCARSAHIARSNIIHTGTKV